MFTNGIDLSRYDTWTLEEMVQQIERPNPWLLRTFFPRQKFFDTAFVEFDILDRGRRMAPFVSPLVAGKPMIREGYRTRQIRPAYIKPTALVVPQEGFVRMAGEGYGGNLSPMQRFDLIVAEHLNLHDEMVDNRLEWMAAETLVNGSITIVGEQYPEVTVNFGRDPSLTAALVGSAKWTTTTCMPLNDIEHYALLVRQISKGAIIRDLVFDSLAWSAFRENSSLAAQLDIRFRTLLPGQTPTAIDQAPRNSLNGDGEYMGTLGGRFNLWLYDAYYQDNNGVDQPYLPPYTVLGMSSALEGTQYFGAIEDLDAEIKAQRMFNKSKVQFNPSGLELVSQSAPLAAPRRPNAMFALTVG